LKIVGVMNQKGGVNKSSVVLNLGFGLADSGKRVLLMDLDSQANLSEIYVEEVGKKDVYFVLTDEEHDINNEIIQCEVDDYIVDNLYILPSSIRLAKATEEIAGQIQRERILERQLAFLEGEWDYLLIDTPPILNSIVFNAINISDYIIVPINYGKYSLDGIYDLFQAINKVKGYDGIDNEFKNYKILRTMYDKRNSTTNRFIEGKIQGYNLFNTRIRKTEAINQAIIAGLPISLYEPNSNGSDDYESLTKELLEWLEGN
jgi:chromosome partitioning protein